MRYACDTAVKLCIANAFCSAQFYGVMTISSCLNQENLRKIKINLDMLMIHLRFQYRYKCVSAAFFRRAFRHRSLPLGNTIGSTEKVTHMHTTQANWQKLKQYRCCSFCGCCNSILHAFACHAALHVWLCLCKRVCVSWHCHQLRCSHPQYSLKQTSNKKARHGFLLPLQLRSCSCLTPP